MNYLEMNNYRHKLSLDEGLFKEVEKTIIDQDDPDYIRKDRERMFNNFKDADSRHKKLGEIYKWLSTHVYIIHNPYYTGFLTQDKENEYFEISAIGSDNFVIDILNPSKSKTPRGNLNFTWMTCYIDSDDGTSPLDANGELPYKIGVCEGSFIISQKSASHGFDYLDFSLRSFKNFPDTVESSLEIKGYSLGTARGENNPFDIQGNFSTLPQGLNVDGEFIIQNCYGLKNFSGMPANIKLGSLSIENCPDLIDCTGWNPSTVLDYMSDHSRWIMRTLSIKNCRNFCSLRGLPDNFTCKSIEIEYCNLRRLDDMPKNLTVKEDLVLQRNYLGGDSLIKYPIPTGVKAKFLHIYPQLDPKGASPYTNISLIPSLDTKRVTKSKDHPVPMPVGIQDFSLWTSHDTNLKSPNSLYWKRSVPEETEYNPAPVVINEGFFKEIDKTLIDLDDPDYVEKDRERMFNQFKEQENKKLHDAVLEWVCNYIYLLYKEAPINQITNINQLKNYGSRSKYLTPKDEGSLFEIVPDTDKFGYIINLFKADVTEKYAVSKLTYIVTTSKDGESPLSEGGLPFKFNYCKGNFKVDCHLRSFKNVPTTIFGSCELGLPAQYVSYQTVDPSHSLALLSTLPANLKVGGNLSLYNVKDLSGMPNITVGNTLYIDGQFKTMEGWNPSVKCKNLTISHDLETLKGLPDGFSCHDLTLTCNHIKEIKDWPKNLTVIGYLNLDLNNLTLDSLRNYPVPLDAYIGYLVIGYQNQSWYSYPPKLTDIEKNRKKPVLIPQSVKNFSIWGVWHNSDGDLDKSRTISDLEAHPKSPYWKWILTK